MPIVEYQSGQVTYQSPALGVQGLYPVWSFPDSIRDAVLEVSTNLQLSVELAAHAALGAISLACQHFVNVQCPPYDPAPVSLFLMAVSNSSGGKSIVEQRFLRAVMAFERKQQDEIEVALPDYRAEMKIWEDDGHRLAKAYREAELGSVEAKGIRAKRLQHEKDRPVQQKKWELRYGEGSPAGLRDALVVNHAVGILSPEAGPVLNGMTFSQPAMLSGYWSGEDRPVGLAGGNRRPIEPRLTISIMAQEDRFMSFMKSRGSDAFGTGLLGRFLVACPKAIEWPGQSTLVEDPPEPKLDLFNQRMADILNQPMPAPRERHTLKLSDGAKRYWKLFKESVHKEMICGNFSDDMKSFFRKIGQQATRLAALFHYFDGAGDEISPEAMEAAIAVCEWYLWECIRVFTPYAPSQQQQQMETAQKLLRWLQDVAAEPWRHRKLTLGRYTERDLRNYSSVRGDPRALEDAINTLHGQGHIAVQIGQKGGRIIFYPPWNQPTQITVNPSFPDQAMQPYFHATLNGAPAIVAQNPTFPVQQMPSCNFNSSNGNSWNGANPAPFLMAAPNQSMGHDHTEADSEQMRAVKQEIQRNAMEADIGPVSLSVSHRRG